MAQQKADIQFTEIFDKIDVMISARDGMKLHTEIYTPKNAAKPLPILLERSALRHLQRHDKGYSNYLIRYDEMIPDGYIFVFQDIRGRYGSEGQFVMQRPVRDPARSKSDRRKHRHLRHHRLARQKCPAQQRPRRHARHFLRRLLAHRMGMLDPHPALKAVSEQASPGRHVSRRRLPSTTARFASATASNTRR